MGDNRPATYTLAASFAIRRGRLVAAVDARDVLHAVVSGLRFVVNLNGASAFARLNAALH